MVAPAGYDGRQPAEWACSSHRGPLLEAAKAEVMETQGQAGCTGDFSQADGAWVLMPQTALPAPAGSGWPSRQSTLLQSFLSN